ncbi:MAG TPA: SRPBCC family protein [Candidatus Acidoferrales bacterium]|nr:SRPBCC family protein [Candidatus Acidoferrales bacterium]
MAEHEASVIVPAPISEVYAMFTHFNDFPKFMTHVVEVSYIDDQHSHWVVDVLGRQSWDAVSENWIPNRQVAWRSTAGAQTSGRVLFNEERPERTRVTVRLQYDPPAGFLGDIAEALGAGSAIERQLQTDLERFATMVAQAPPGALDPTSSNYLFHDESAAVRNAGETAAAASAPNTDRGRFENDGEDLDEEVPHSTASVPERRL